MTRRSDGTWEINHGEMKRLLVLWPLLGVLFSAGAAWAGVRYGLEGKVDKPVFMAYVYQRDSLFQVHVKWGEEQALRLRLSDSLQQAAQRESNDRLREIVCDAIKKPGCR